MGGFISLSSKTVTDHDINEIEKLIQFTLPKDYKDFLKEYNGAKPRNNCVCSFKIHWCSEKRDVLQGLYCIDTDLKDLNIGYWLSFYKDYIVKRDRFVMIPIGVDPFGSTIFMKRNGKIVLSDFSHSFRSSFGSKCFYPLANSFSDFLTGLVFEE